MMGFVRTSFCFVSTFHFLLLLVCGTTRTTVVLANDNTNNDFGNLNALLQRIEGLQIPLPEGGFTVGDSPVSVTLRNAVCSAFSVDNIVVQAATAAASTTNVELALEGLDFRCVFDYSYTFLFTRRGTVNLNSVGNAVSLDLQMQTAPPPDVFVSEPRAATALEVQSCAANVQITEFDVVNGSISAVVVETVLRLLRDGVERTTGAFLCQQLRQMASEDVAQELARFDEHLAQFYPPLFTNADMLAAEVESVGIPDSVELWGFQHPGNTRTSSTPNMREWVQQVVNEASLYLSQQVETPTGVDLNVNVLLRENVLDSKGSFHLDFDPIPILERHDRLTQTVISIHGIQLVGLDTVTSLEPMEFVGNQTVQTTVAFEDLHFELDLSIDMQPSSLPDSYVINPTSSNVARERITVTFGVEGFRADASLFLAIDNDILGSLKLGSLLRTESILPCMLSTLLSAQIGGITLEAANIRPPTLAGFVSPGVDRVVTNTVEAAFLVYGQTVRQALPGLFHLVVREAVNKQMTTQYLPKLDRDCPILSSSNFSETGYVDFRDLLLPPEEALAKGATGAQPYGDLMHLMFSAFRERLVEDGEDGSPMINSLVRSLIEKQSGETPNATLLLGDMFSSSSSFQLAGLDANLFVSVTDASVDNLDSFGKPFQLLEPVMGEPNVLNSSISVGMGGNEVNFNAKVTIALFDGKGLRLNNTVDVSLELSALELAVALVAEILESPFFSVPLKDTSNINCWMGSLLPPPNSPNVTGVGFAQRDLSVASLFVTFACAECSSPDFDDLLYQLYSPDFAGNVTGALRNLYHLFTESDYVRNLSDEVVEIAAKQCPSSPKYDQKVSYRDLFRDGGAGSILVESGRDRRAHLFNIANAAIAIVVVGIYFLFRKRRQKRYEEWEKTTSAENIRMLEALEQRERADLEQLNTATSSIFRTESIPLRIRYGFPIALLFTIVLQLVGHLALLSSVDVQGLIAGEDFVVESFLEFSFFKALKRTARNGGVEMAILAFVFTGIWPYIKLLVSLGLWFLPPSKLSVDKRGRILLWLDVFAKQSVVDIMTLLVAIGCILVYVGGLDESLTGEASYEMKAIIYPGWGCYSIVMAQRMLRVSSRFMLDNHNKIAHPELTETAEEESLRTMKAEDSMNEFPVRDVTTDGNFQREESKRFSPLAIFAISTVILIGIIGASLAPGVAIDTQTVWGIIGSGRTYNQAVEGLPLFRVITETLMQSRLALSSLTDYIGFGFLLALVVITSTAFPFLSMISAIRSWIHRRRTEVSKQAVVVELEESPSLRDILTRSASSGLEAVRTQYDDFMRSSFLKLERGTQLTALHQLRAFQQLDVFVAAFVISCWQLGAVAAYSIHLYCHLLERIYESVERLGLIERTESRSRCFPNQASQPTTVTIISLGFLFLIVSFAISTVSHYNKLIRKSSEKETIVVAV